MAQLHVIEQEMTNDQLVVRHHVEDFNAKSQLIVYESQEALFYKNGQALDLFPSGRHELTSENVPLLKRIFGGLFGGKTPLPCDVYFINKVNVLDVIWGTDSPIELEDPKYHLLVRVRANGQTGIRVKDSRRFAAGVPTFASSGCFQDGFPDGSLPVHPVRGRWRRASVGACPGGARNGACSAATARCGPHRRKDRRDRFCRRR